MLPDEEISFTRVLDASFLNTPEQLIGITIFGIVSLLVEVPWIWISRGEKAEKIKSRIGLWVVYCPMLWAETISFTLSPHTVRLS